MELAAHPLTEVRERQYDADPDWLSVAKEGICEVLRRQQFVHADDLEPLGIPDAHRNVIGSAFAALSSRKWIVAVDRRASKVRRRNCRKSGVYRATSDFPRSATIGMEGGNAPEFSHVGSGASAHSLHSDGAGVGGRGEPVLACGPVINCSAAVKAPDSASSGKIVGDGAGGEANDQSPCVSVEATPNTSSTVPGDQRSPGNQSDNAVPVSAVGLSAIPGEPTPLFELPPERPPHDRVAEAA